MNSTSEDILIRGLSDIIQIAEIASVVHSQLVPEDEILDRALSTIMELLTAECFIVGNTEIVDSVLHVRPWPLSPEQAVERVRREWVAFGSSGPGLGDIGWLQITAKGRTCGEAILAREAKIVQQVKDRSTGAIVSFSELRSLVQSSSPDKAGEELKESTLSVVFELLAREIVEIGSVKGDRPGSFVPWRPREIEESLALIRRKHAEPNRSPQPGDICAFRVIYGAKDTLGHGS